MPRFAIIDAPSVLGLKPTGVEQLPEALKAAGLHTGLNAEYAGLVTPPTYDSKRDPETLLLNPAGLRKYAQQLAEAVTRVLQQGQFPVVLGGDCSNLIGCTLALRRLGRYGLVFIDGHADFYQPEAEPNGEVASMDLAIVSGRGPDVLIDIDGLKPLMRDEDIVLFGYRDAEQQREYGCQDVRMTAINVFDLDRVCVRWESRTPLIKPLKYYEGMNLKNSGFIWMPMCWTMRLCPQWTIVWRAD